MFFDMIIFIMLMMQNHT